MKKIIFLLAISLCFATISIAQSQYESGMNKAFGLWKEGKNSEAVALFERIAQAEKDNWIPMYHAANLLISDQFQLKDVTVKNDMLKKAKGIIENAHKRSENNSELLTLEGMLYTAYVAMDPDTYGMKYAPIIMQLHGKASGINPNNPRALANQIEFEMGSARFFGNDLSPFCEKMKEIIPKFENEKPSEPFAPSHGLERAKQIADSCNG